MRLMTLISFLVFTFSFNVNAIESGKVECDTVLELCQYSPVHRGNNFLVAKVTQAMSKDLDYLVTADYYIYPSEPNEIIFWVNPDVDTTTSPPTTDFKLLNKMKGLLKKFDTKINILDKDKLRVQIEIVSISDQGMRSFNAGLADRGADEGQNNLAGGLLNIPFTGISSLIKLQLGLEKAKERAGEVTSLDLELEEGERLNDSKEVTLYYSPNTAVVKDKTVGTSFHGTFRIDADDPNKVLLTGFHFSLGRPSGVTHPDGTEAVESISHPMNRMILYSGESNILFKHNSYRYVDKKSARLFGVNKEKFKVNEKLMLIITVHTMSKEDLAADREKEKKSKRNFTKAEKASLPADGVSLQEMLQSAQFKSNLLSNGNFRLKILLNKDVATREHVDKMIQVNYKINDEKKEMKLSLNRLMNDGAILETEPEWFSDIVKINLSLKPLWGRKKEKVQFLKFFSPVEQIFFNKQ